METGKRSRGDPLPGPIADCCRCRLPSRPCWNQSLHPLFAAHSQPEEIKPFLAKQICRKKLKKSKIREEAAHHCYCRCPLPKLELLTLLSPQAEAADVPKQTGPIAVVQGEHGTKFRARRRPTSAAVVHRQTSKPESSHPFADPGPASLPWTLAGAGEVSRIPGEALQTEQHCPLSNQFPAGRGLSTAELDVQSDPGRASDKYLQPSTHVVAGDRCNIVDGSNPYRDSFRRLHAAADYRRDSTVLPLPSSADRTRRRCYPRRSSPSQPVLEKERRVGVELGPFTCLALLCPPVPGRYPGAIT